jgi:acetoin:2,6-dichlorophenolindophenol oxidoreductase subunit alpha
MNIKPEVLRELYGSMLLMRLSEEAFVPYIEDGTIKCPVHLYSGEEAIAAGIGAHLREIDYVFGNHRSHGHYLAKGGDLDRMTAEVFCRRDGCCRGRGGSMHLIDPEAGVLGIAPIVAGTISLALGAALAASVRKDGRVAVTFFGDGATGEGVLYEAMNFASIRKLPLIFVCENNLYSTHLPIREIRVDVPICESAKPFGIFSRRLDGNDVLAMYEAAGDAVARCRNGEGPVFLECMTYRFRGHVGPDDNIQGTHTDIRPPDEFRNWLEKDPVTRFEKYLTEQGVMTPEQMTEIKNATTEKVKASVDAALRSERPPKQEVEKYVFTEKA